LKDFVAYWNAGNLIAAANQVMSRHKYIMQKRNSAAWVEEENKKLKIRVEHHHKPVYPQKNFSYSYFIDSYIRLMRAYMKEANA
jgi:Ca2+-dependent lipid-binding protein